MNQNVYGMSTIICRDNLELNKRIKKRFDTTIGILDASKKLVPDEKPNKSDKQLEVDKAMRELCEGYDIEVFTKKPPQIVPQKVQAPVAPKMQAPVAPKMQAPVAPKMQAPVAAVTTAALTLLPLNKSLFTEEKSEFFSEKKNFSPRSPFESEVEDDENSSAEDSSVEDSDDDEDSENSFAEDSTAEDSTVEDSTAEDAENSFAEDSSPEDDDYDDDEFDNDCNSLDHIVPGNCYTDLGQNIEINKKTNYIKKVGDLKKLSEDLGITNYNVYLEKYGNEFVQNGKTVHPWEKKKCFAMLDKIEQILINENEARNMDKLVRRIASTGFIMLENFTGGSVKIPFTKKKFPTRGLSSLYQETSLLYRDQHRDLTNKVTMGYRPSGAISFFINYGLKILERPLEDDDEDEMIKIDMESVESLMR